VTGRSLEKTTVRESRVGDRVEVACVLCGCGEAEIRYRLGDVRVQRCVQCGLVALQPRFPEGDVESVYEAHVGGRTAVGAGAGEKGGCLKGMERRPIRPVGEARVNRRRLGVMESLTRGRDLLDVGAAAGLFLLDAKARGWRVRGIEVSAPAVALAESRGLRMERGTLRDARLEHDALDAVTMWNVIEHLHDPVRDLRKVRRSLRARGVLAVSTPNYDSVIRTVRGAGWHGFKVGEHLSIFSPSTIGMLFEETGFEPVRLTTNRTELIRARRFLAGIQDRAPGAVYEMLRLGRAAVNGTLGKMLFFAWESLLRGDRIEVYARRR